MRTVLHTDPGTTRKELARSVPELDTHIAYRKENS